MKCKKNITTAATVCLSAVFALNAQAATLIDFGLSPKTQIKSSDNDYGTNEVDSILYNNTADPAPGNQAGFDAWVTLDMSSVDSNSYLSIEVMKLPSNEVSELEIQLGSDLWPGHFNTWRFNLASIPAGVWTNVQSTTTYGSPVNSDPAFNPSAVQLVRVKGRWTSPAPVVAFRIDTLNGADTLLPLPSEYAPLGLLLSGWSQDVIVEASATNAYDATTFGWQYWKGAVLPQVGYVSTNDSTVITEGLPLDGVITSPNPRTRAINGTNYQYFVEYQLGSATMNNSATSGDTLTLASPMSLADADKLFLLGASVAGGSTYNVVLNFSGGLSTTNTVVVEDWYSLSPANPVALGERQNLSRKNDVVDIWSGAGKNKSNLYEMEIALSAQQQAGTLQSIGLVDASDPGRQVARFLAVSTTKPVVVPTILSFDSVGTGVAKMVVGISQSADKYSPVARGDLMTGSWAAVPHADNAAGPFVVSNLTYSATDGAGNKEIYVETTETQKFFGIGE